VLDDLAVAPWRAGWKPLTHQIDPPLVRATASAGQQLRQDRCQVPADLVRRSLGVGDQADSHGRGT
jgi:hypothetical protein